MTVPARPKPNAAQRAPRSLARGLSVFLALALAVFSILLGSCTSSDVINVARVATGDSSAAVDLARNRAVRYAANPRALEADYRQFRSILASFRRAVEGNWGKGDAAEPQPKQYVKYTQNYLSRAQVDFENGRVIVETLDQEAPRASLRAAVATTLMTPRDPRAVDLYSAGPVRLGGTPFLLGEVKDQKGRDIRTEQQAEAFAQKVVEESMQERPAGAGTDNGRMVRFVVIPMTANHLQVRAAKFRPQVEEAARRFKVSRTLIYAVIRVESDFNPFAINAVPAVGLMQVVPQSAGAEVQALLTGRRGEPSKAQLFDPEQNITFGAAYLHLLDTRHLAAVADPVSREYCTIAAYNGGPGALLKTFHPVRGQALASINATPPMQVYEAIVERHAALETRRYLEKVLAAKKQFAGL